MTIVFQGHVKSAETFGSKVRVHLVTPMAETDGCGMTIIVSEKEAANWTPGRSVSFTIYALAMHTDLIKSLETKVFQDGK